MVEYKRLEIALGEIGELLRESYKEKLLQGGISQSGKLFNSVQYRIEVTKTGTNVYFQAEDYYINIEEGRAPNSKMPPVEDIRRWMISKGIPAIKGLDFVIARSIGRKGIKPRPFLRESKIDMKQYEVQMKEALDLDIKEHLDNNIKGVIKNQIKES